MDNTAKASGMQNERSDTTRSHRRRNAAIAAVIAVLAIGIVLFVVQKRQAHLERLDRTDRIATSLTSEVEEKLKSVAPLTASEIGQLRTYGNKDHVAAAQQLGIDGLDSDTQAKKLNRDNELVRIKDGAYYTIQDLDHSVPFLVPSGSVLLDQIGERFHAALAEEGLPAFQFVVTSVTRTEAHQKALRQVNVNAAAKSSHEYGTTFDLHYAKFGFNGQPAIPDSSNIYKDILAESLATAFDRLSREYDSALKAVLGRELIALQKQGTAMARYERRQPVFHVTVAEDLASPHSDSATAFSRK